jgi:hypothetical protein
MSGGKDSLPNTKLDPLKGADAAKSSKADSQPQTPVEPKEPTDSIPKESQGGKDETKEKGDGKSNEPPKDS